MATYQYACGCHEETQDFPMGKAPDKIGTCARCVKPIRRVFTAPAIVYGPGMRPPWADRIQKSKEMDERFARRGT